MKPSAHGMQRSARANSDIRRARLRCSSTSCDATKLGQPSSHLSEMVRKSTLAKRVCRPGGRHFSSVPNGIFMPHRSLSTRSEARQRLFVGAAPDMTFNPDLHLDVPIRSIKSAAAAPWVDAVLKGDVHLAREIADKAHGVPFLLTRSLQAMRGYLRDVARGLRRAGLVCSAGARRLRADGIYPNFPHMEADTVANWFLARWPDVRASDALETPATQFACQGLELDYVGLCWGNDLIQRFGNRGWIARNFVGSRWQEPRGEAAIAYQINTYRVLMTRARYATVIWVPEGDVMDITRDPESFDSIAEFLAGCGTRPLEESPHKEPVPTIQTSLI